MGDKANESWKVWTRCRVDKINRPRIELLAGRSPRIALLNDVLTAAPHLHTRPSFAVSNTGLPHGPPALWTHINDSGDAQKS